MSGQRRQTFAEGAVADLVVVLQEVDEDGGRQAGTRLAAQLAAPIGRGLSLIDEARCQGFGKTLNRLVTKISIVAAGLAGEDVMGDVVPVIVPLSTVERWLALAIARQQAGEVGIVFQDQMDVAPVFICRADRLGDLDQEMTLTVVADLIEQYAERSTGTATSPTIEDISTSTGRRHSAAPPSWKPCSSARHVDRPTSRQLHHSMVSRQRLGMPGRQAGRPPSAGPPPASRPAGPLSSSRTISSKCLPGSACRMLQDVARQGCEESTTYRDDQNEE